MRKLRLPEVEVGAKGIVIATTVALVAGIVGTDTVLSFSDAEAAKLACTASVTPQLLGSFVFSRAQLASSETANGAGSIAETDPQLVGLLRTAGMKIVETTVFTNSTDTDASNYERIIEAETFEDKLEALIPIVDTGIDTFALQTSNKAGEPGQVLAVTVSVPNC